MPKKNKRILLADDMDVSDPAGKSRSHDLRLCAARLAKKLNSSIELVHVEDITLYPVSNPYYRKYINDLISKRRFHLKKAASSLKVPVHTSLIEGYPVEKITELTSQKNRFEMIVMGTHGRTGLKRVLLGSVAEEIVRNSKIPVLTLGPASQNQSFLDEATIRILVATDLSSTGVAPEKYALSLAQRLNAKVTLFHTMLSDLRHPSLDPAFSLSPYETEMQDDLAEKLRPKATMDLNKKEDFYKKNGIDCTSVLDTISINTSSAILKQIKKTSPSLIIMGTHGRNLFSGAFLGNTARQIIRSSPVPVIVVRSL